MKALTDYLAKEFASTVRGRGRTGAIANEESGLALVSTLMVTVLVAFLVAAALSSTISVTRSASAEYEAAAAFYAAEAGSEAALAGMELAMLDGFVTQSELDGLGWAQR